MGAPSDRNLVDLNVDGGLVFSGFVPGRPADTFGIAAALAGISDRAKGLDRDLTRVGTPTPIGKDEILVELTYLAEIVPGWTLQPDFQYVWRPGGNVAADGDATPLRDAAVIGVRTSINY